MFLLHFIIFAFYKQQYTCKQSSVFQKLMCVYKRINVIRSFWKAFNVTAKIYTFFFFFLLFASVWGGEKARERERDRELFILAYFNCKNENFCLNVSHKFICILCVFVIVVIVIVVVVIVVVVEINQLSCDIKRLNVCKTYWSSTWLSSLLCAVYARRRMLKQK